MRDGVSRTTLPQKVLTARQAMAIVMTTVIGVGVLALPRLMVEQAGTAGPLAVALATGVGVLGVCIQAAVCRRFPNLTIFQAAELITGQVVGKVFALLMAALFALLAALTAREFAEVIVTTVLRRTPLEISLIVLILLAASAARNNIATLGRIHQFYLPLVVIPGVLIVLLALKDARMVNLLPVWGAPGRILRGTLVASSLYQSWAIVGVIQPFLKRRSGAAVSGMVVAGAVYVLTVAGTLAVLGPQMVARLVWPTLELAKSTSVPGGVLERLDAPFVTVWMTAVFTTTYSLYLVSITALTNALGLEDHKTLVFPLIPLLFFIALRPPDVQNLYRSITYVGLAGLPLTLLWPVVLWLTARFRRLRTDESI